MPIQTKPDYVVSAAELVVKLRATGTGEQKINVARSALRKAFAEGREATVDEVLESLAASGFVSQETYDKALAIAQTGSWSDKVEAVDLPIEERLYQATQATPPTPVTSSVPPATHPTPPTPPTPTIEKPSKK